MRITVSGREAADGDLHFGENHLERLPSWGVLPRLNRYSCYGSSARPDEYIATLIRMLLRIFGDSVRITRLPHSIREPCGRCYESSATL